MSICPELDANVEGLPVIQAYSLIGYCRVKKASVSAKVCAKCQEPIKKGNLDTFFSNLKSD
jgi:hypothetical protein